MLNLLYCSHELLFFQMHYLLETHMRFTRYRPLPIPPSCYKNVS